MRSFFNRPTFLKKSSYRKTFFVLIFLLLIIIFLQKELTKPQFQKAVKILLNINKKPPLSASLKKQKLFWCSTRVEKLNISNSVFVNKNFKWYLNQVAIDSLFMERWLAKYCKLKIFKIISPLKLQNKKALFCVTFINNHKQCFYKTAQGTFLWKNKLFLSSQLQEGFNKILFLTNKR